MFVEWVVIMTVGGGGRRLCKATDRVGVRFARGSRINIVMFYLCRPILYFSLDRFILMDLKVGGMKLLCCMVIPPK